MRARLNSSSRAGKHQASWCLFLSRRVLSLRRCEGWRAVIKLLALLGSEHRFGLLDGPNPSDAQISPQFLRFANFRFDLRKVNGGLVEQCRDIQFDDAGV